MNEMLIFSDIFKNVMLPDRFEDFQAIMNFAFFVQSRFLIIIWRV